MQEQYYPAYEARAESSVLPDGYAGGLMVELEEERRVENALGEFILNRARSLAWQAVRHTPGDSACAGACLVWIHQARLWAARRDLEELAGELGGILCRLQESLPRLNTLKYQ